MTTNRKSNPNDLTPEQIAQAKRNLMELLEARMHGEEALRAKISELWERNQNSQEALPPPRVVDLRPEEIISIHERPLMRYWKDGKEINLDREAAPSEPEQKDD